MTWAIVHPAAHLAVRFALDQGLIHRPSQCGQCGLTSDVDEGERSIEAHHHDYNQLIDVRWLCRDCHVREHAKKQPYIPNVCGEKGEALLYDLIRGICHFRKREKLPLSKDYVERCLQRWNPKVGDLYVSLFRKNPHGRCVSKTDSMFEDNEMMMRLVGFPMGRGLSPIFQHRGKYVEIFQLAVSRGTPQSFTRMKRLKRVCEEFLSLISHEEVLEEDPDYSTHSEGPDEFDVLIQRIQNPRWEQDEEDLLYDELFGS